MWIRELLMVEMTACGWLLRYCPSPNTCCQKRGRSRATHFTHLVIVITWARGIVWCILHWSTRTKPWGLSAVYTIHSECTNKAINPCTCIFYCKPGGIHFVLSLKALWSHSNSIATEYNVMRPGNIKIVLGIFLPCQAYSFHEITILTMRHRK